MGSVVQIAGAIAILVAFVLAQRGRLSQHGVLYLALNGAGAAVLAVDAYVESQWGFLLLESVWALVAAASLTRVLRDRAPRTE